MRTSAAWTTSVLVLLALLAPAAAQPTSDSPKEPPRISEIGGKKLQQWIKEMESGDPSIRERAIRTIIIFGPEAARTASPGLVTRLSDPDSSVRTNAAIALGSLGLAPEHRDRVVEALSRTVAEDKQVVVRYYAAYALGRFGPDARAAIPSLVLAIKDRNSWEVRKASAFALGTTATDFKIGPDMRAYYALTDSLKDYTSEVRMEAAIAIVGLGKPMQPGHRVAVVNHLRGRLLEERDKEVLIWLHLAHLVNGAEEEKTVTAIAGFLKDKDAAVREQAANALGMLGARSESRIPQLLDALNDKEPQVVVAVVLALASTGKQKDKINAAFIDVYNRKDTPEPIKKVVEQVMERMKKAP